MKKTCSHGHELTPENSYTPPGKNYSECKTCRRKNSERYRRESSSHKARKQHFGGNREKAIQRDGEKCVECGMTRSEHKATFNFDITVDHIDGKGRNTPNHLKNNDLANLQTLCLRCHGRKDNTAYKLTEEQVFEILDMKGSASQYKIAEIYGVTRPAITQILNGTSRSNIFKAWQSQSTKQESR